ncbi:MAG: guanylate kinase [Christensenellales bacterium]|jgi:guanylate kinase
MRVSRKGMLIVISAPSGTGKGTLCARLLKNHPEMRFSVSATTRQPRVGEENHKHYHFISEEQFDQLLAEDAFLEHATVHGHRYGTLRAEVDAGIKAGACMLLDIDTQGALSVMSKMHNTVSVFILPPSYQVLRQRLYSRNTDCEDEIERRLDAARAEVAMMRRYRYVIINDNLDEAYQQLHHIIEAEKLRTIRYYPTMDE